MWNVTGDETWISFFEPEGKENNKVWIGENGARPQSARRSRSVKRVLYALFFDARGIVARIPVPEHKTVTGIYYAEQVLPAVVNHYMATCPRTGVRGLKLHHDNAQPTAQPWCRTVWKHKDLKLYHISRTVQIWHHVTSGWTLSNSALVDANSKPAQLSEERYLNAQTVYLNVTIKAHSKTGLNAWKNV